MRVFLANGCKLNKRQVIGALLGVALIWWLLCLPTPLFDVSYSTVVESGSGSLLSARIAADGQWRFPAKDTLDARYASAVKVFEDEYFERHPGINPVSFLRAFRQNIQARRIVSGGSTLTMQTVRLMRGKQSRSIWEKLIEVALATRLEMSYSKPEILSLYAAHAPFGGNVVGIEAAAWRYYGRSATHFSWAEAAALAVLPNAPGIIYPGRSNAAFLRKRNMLLEKLYNRGFIDETELVLAKAEPLPGEPHQLPDLAPHLADHYGMKLDLALDETLQRRTVTAIARQHERNRGNGVHNAAALILDTQTGSVLAYVGNTSCDERGSGRAVDVVQARRSSGSLLKPFLYATLLDEGSISPTTLVADIPTLIGDYAPKNFDLTYDGAVPAGQALTRSLNIPHVRLLQEYGIDPMLQKLRRFGFQSLDRSAEHYGLSLILGGGEVRLWDVAHAYRKLARIVEGEAGQLSASAAYLTLSTLTQLERPGDLAAWRSFAGSRKVAWKTGTSFGHRDAWAVGVTPEYTVAVWTGNADGEGRTGLTGASVAAPLLFELFDELPASSWFSAPVAEMAEVILCRQSGNQAARDCPVLDTTLLPARGQRLATCSYHARVFTDELGRRVDASCASLAEARPISTFTLPPAWAYYYRRTHVDYAPAPAWAPQCEPASDEPMALIYPRGASNISLPRDLDGSRQAIAFQVAHERANSQLWWHIDGALVGTTTRNHELMLQPATGRHLLTVIDESGRQLKYDFEVAH